MRGSFAGRATALLIAATGCLGPRVLVIPSGTGVPRTPKARDCKIELFRTRIERPYDEVAAIHTSGGDSFRNGLADFQEALRVKACDLGADAVIVTRDFSGPGGVMDGVAVRYR